MEKIDRKKVFGKYGGHCAYCGRQIEYKDMQVDHITPRRNGGTDDISNLNLTAFEMREERYGDTHVVKQSLQKEVYQAMTDEERNAQPILGSLKPLEPAKTGKTILNQLNK